MVGRVVSVNRLFDRRAASRREGQGSTTYRPSTTGVGNIVAGVFQPVLAKHTKHFNLNRAISGGIDDMQRNFAPMVQAVERWRESQLSEVAAKLLIYRAFVEGDLEAPRALARKVHELYFNPQVEEFQARTMWSLSNAFTSALKELDPIPQYRATAKLGTFLQAGAVG